MSTKALYELIRRVEGTTLQPEAEAMKELSAIERAAFVLIADGVIPEADSNEHSEEARKAMSLMRAIANVEVWGRE